jgi:hypothetical protein
MAAICNPIANPITPALVLAAAKNARIFAHGSYNHSQAMSTLFRAFRAANPENPNPTLAQLWYWVNLQFNGLN